MAGWLDEWVMEKSTGALGIKLSQKEAALNPFGDVFSAIGATFDMRVGSAMVMPNTPVVEKLRVMVSNWRPGEMARWEAGDVERWVGLVSYIVAFLGSRKAKQARWRMIRKLKAQPAVPAGLRFVRQEVRPGLVEILEECDRRNFEVCCGMQGVCTRGMVSARMRTHPWTVS